MEDVKTKVINEFDNIKFSLDNLLQDPDFDPKYVDDVHKYIDQMSATIKYIEDEKSGQK